MTFNHGLKSGDVLSNQQLAAIFKCSPQGGMRRSLKTNTLVIISNHIESTHDDKWHGDVLHYTGMGPIGDQSLTHSQNKTLAQSRDNGVEVYLFEVFESLKYTFIGPVELIVDPYQATQPDSEGRARLVWVFPLSLKEGAPYLERDVIQKRDRFVESRAERLSDAIIRQRACYADPAAGSRRVVTTIYSRNPYVSEYVKRQARGICQLCHRPAPFRDKNGAPYLETHQVVWLSRGGEDTIANTVALCPNCHRRMHVLNRDSDRFKLAQCNLFSGE